jgi:HJR/Mrr/RecB family endonuclease
MNFFKFNGVLQEVIEQYPTIDLVEYLQDELQISRDKAEDLAARIQKKCLSTQKPTQQKPEQLLQKLGDAGFTPKRTTYSVDSLSEKEFENFMKWLIKELGYEVQPEINRTLFGVDFIASKTGEKFVIHVQRVPKPRFLSNLILALVEEVKHFHGCDKSIIIASTYFTEQLIDAAQDASVELWGCDVLDAKIAEAQKNTYLTEVQRFPPYHGSLLQSLLCLEDTRDFLIASRADQKYDFYLPGVKYPLLTFQVKSGSVIRCVYRIQSNEPVGELDAEALISCDSENNRLGPDDAEAYRLITEYLDHFLK